MSAAVFTKLVFKKLGSEPSAICAAMIIAFNLFSCRPAFAEQNLVIHYLPEQIAITKPMELSLQEIVKSDGFFVIKVNKYDEKQSEKRCLPRKYALVRALELRKVMIKNGVRLDKIKIIVTTNRHEENNIAIIDVHRST